MANGFFLDMSEVSSKMGHDFDSTIEFASYKQIERKSLMRTHQTT